MYCEYIIFFSFLLYHIHSGEKCGVDGSAVESVGVSEPLMVGDSSPGDSSSYSCMQKTSEISLTLSSLSLSLSFPSPYIYTSLQVQQSLLVVSIAHMWFQFININDQRPSEGCRIYARSSSRPVRFCRESPSLALWHVQQLCLGLWGDGITSRVDAR